MIGEMFGSYRVVRRLGQGGMGVVYLAEHPLLGKKAVVKQLLPEVSQHPEIVQRFFNEARAATLIQHPGIVDVFDFGYHASGSAFIAMEFLGGEALAARLERERALPVELALRVTRQIASAVGAAHQAGIVHRDLKPDNVFLVPDAESPGAVRVKVLDFGIAKLAGTEHAGVKTRTGAVMGTPIYMSPEQCHGAAELDHRADIYSIGCILFELLAGRPPFTGDGLGAILGAHMFQPPPRLRDVAPACPPPLDALVAWMLAKDPRERPQSLEVVVQHVDAMLAGGIGGAAGAGDAGGGAGVASASASSALPLVHATSTPPAVRAPITTLGHAASQLAPTATLPRRRRTAAYVGAGIAAIGAAAIAIAIGARGSGRDASRAAIAIDAAVDDDASRCLARDTGTAIDRTAAAAAAMASCERACARDVTAACGRVAHALVTGTAGVPADPARGVSLATRGCDAGEPEACVALAMARRDGIGVAADVTAAISAAVRACDAVAAPSARAADATDAPAPLPAAPSAALGCAIAVPMLAMSGDTTRAAALASRARDPLAVACRASDDAACLALASLHAKDLGAPRDLAAAAAVLQAACDRAAPDACVRLARVYELGQGARPDRVRARELSRTARAALAAHCDHGAASACASLAAGLAAEPDRDAPRIAALLATACDRGDGAACLSRAAMLAAGDGVPRDATLAADQRRRAATLLPPACAAGDPAACIRAADLLARGLGTAKDPARAASLLRAACNADHAAACPRWAELDPPHATTAFSRALAAAVAACDAGDLSGCDLAGDVHALGPAPLARAADALPFYRRACDGGLAEGCFDLAWAHRADPTTATPLYRRACDDGFGPACTNLGMAASDPTEAARHFEQGCAQSDATSCLALSRTTRDATRARLLASRACALGLAAACD